MPVAVVVEVDLVVVDFPLIVVLVEDWVAEIVVVVVEVASHLVHFLPAK